MLTFMVSGDLWSQYLYETGIIELQPNQIKVAQEALIRFSGSETYVQKWKDGELDYKDQYIIDQNARLFNVKYAEKLPSHKIKLIADIVNMPEIELEAEVWAEAQQILDDEVGTVWQDYMDDTLPPSANVAYIEEQLIKFIGSETLLLKWKNNQLTAKDSELISTNILSYIETFGVELADIWFLPTSNLTNSEWQRAVSLAENEIGDLWIHAKDFPFGIRSDEEQSELRYMSKRMFGNEEVWEKLIWKGQVRDQLIADTIVFMSNFTETSGI